MWTSSELKERAKIALTGSYWKALAISLILSFAVGGSGGGSGFNSMTNVGSMSDQDMSTEAIIGIAILFLVIFSVISLFTLAIKIFIGFPLEAGGRKYFTLAAMAVNTKEQVPFNVIGFGFKSNVYRSIIKTLFFRSLYIFLWTLCFIIPGIIRGYAYAMVPYLLSENPNLTTQRALELSKQMTDGEKMDMLILDLSFILWWLLGCVTCFIGFIFIAPYYNATHAELYLVLKEKALEEGIATQEDFEIKLQTL